MQISKDLPRTKRFCWRGWTTFPNQWLRRSTRLKKWKLFSRTKIRLLRSWIRRLEINRRDLCSLFQRVIYLIRCFLIISTRQTAQFQLERLEMDSTCLELRKFSPKFLMANLSLELAEDSWSLKNLLLPMLRQRWIKSIRCLMNNSFRCTLRVNPWLPRLILTLNCPCIETLPLVENLDHQTPSCRCQRAIRKSMGLLEVAHNFELKWNEINSTV